MAAKPRVKVPKKAAAGDIITIKTLISHKMESGHRRDDDGNVLPREIINHFVADFNGETVFEADLQPSVSSNPYIEFSAKVNESGTFTFSWTDDNGEVYTKDASIDVA